MTRLTNNIREAITKKLLTRSFKERGDDLVKRCADFADRLYNDALEKELERINSLPKGWLPTDDDIMVMFGPSCVTIKFRGTLERWGTERHLSAAGVAVPERQERPFPNSKKGAVVKQYQATHSLAKEFQKLQDERNDLEELIAEAGQRVRATLESVGTVKKLIEVWPEVEEFAKPYLHEGERRAVLPDIPRAQLNKMLDLPPEEKAA